MDRLGNLGFKDWPCGLLWLVLAALTGAYLIRVFFAVLAAYHPKTFDVFRPGDGDALGRAVYFRRMLMGDRGDPQGRHAPPDAYTGFILGTAQLIMFPVLIRLDAWSFIAAWLAGTIAMNWSDWAGGIVSNRTTQIEGSRSNEANEEFLERYKNKRIRLNAFLISTAMVIILSVVISSRLFKLGVQ
jgi:hypothetical protein